MNRLALLAKANRREPMSQREVADLCGVTQKAVWELERIAFKKLRAINALAAEYFTHQPATPAAAASTTPPAEPTRPPPPQPT